MNRCALVLALAVMACEPAPPDTPSPPPPPPVAEVLAEPAPEPTKRVLTLAAGGDVSFGRMRGQKLLADPSRDDLAQVAALFDDADLRFVNLESVIFDNGWSTVHPDNILVYNAPPAAAPALARAKIDIVSLANNHAWDYGRKALFETFERLEAEGIAYVGAGRTRERAYGHQLVQRDGFGVAFIAVTSIWNQVLRPHPGKEHVADAVEKELVAAVERAKATPGVDKVVVSHHGGEEYRGPTYPPIVRMLRAALDAGADAVIGHHPHIAQRAALVRGRPVFYSLGNLIFRDTGKGGLWAKFGAVARITFRRDGPTTAWLCPVRMVGSRVLPLAAERDRAAIEGIFRHHYDRLMRRGSSDERDAPTQLGVFGEDGCAELIAL
jgi:poly-gamma-glutamate capsule biosynthesis protein CapA/YwtB (metallophosphatase superfamily)